MVKRDGRRPARSERRLDAPVFPYGLALDRQARLLHAVHYRLSGRTQAQSARLLQVHQSTVSRDLRRWRERARAGGAR